MSSGTPGLSSKKIAIPRLQRVNPSQPSKDRRRVSRACTACRSHKIKCTGDVPQCKHCETTGRECVYIMPRKDRLKTVTERSAQMARLLKKLRGFANDEDGARITDLLEANEEDLFDTRHTPTISIPDTNDEDWNRPANTFGGDADEPFHGLNAGSLDLVDENLHETDQARATGFVGPNSEVQWLRTFLLLERGDSDMANSERAGSAISGQVSAVTFYLDNQSIDPEIHVDPYELPAPDVAEQLLSIYMEKVHDSFPILPRTLFSEQCRRYFEGLRQGLAPRLSSKWQAILNLVFAIGAKYSHLVKASFQPGEREHLVYKARAHVFAWNENTLEKHPDLPQIQVTGLLAFYYLSVGQVSRAWVVVGVALRFATALGLHVRNEDPSASEAKREVLVRVWWSLYYLERQLSIITGRPSVIVDSCCSVPLPVPFSEQQIAENANLIDASRRSSLASNISLIASSHTFSSDNRLGGDSGRSPPKIGVAEPNTASYFRAVVQMCIVTQSILTSLYSAATLIRSPGDIQQDIVRIGERIDIWAQKLPVEFNFQNPQNHVAMSNNVTFRQRTILAFQFCNAKILLTRPCLSGLGKAEKEHVEAAVSSSFSRRMAGICVDAAKMELDLLPDQPQPRFVYEFGPWWTLVHHLMQALAVFLLALSYSPATQQDNLVLADYCLKIIRWLHAMEDLQAERAHQVAIGCYEIIATRLSLPGAKMWTSSQMPDSGIAQHGAAQPALHGFHPTITGMQYGPDSPTPAYSGMTGDSSTFSYTSEGLFIPSASGQLYNGTYLHPF